MECRRRADFIGGSWRRSRWPSATAIDDGSGSRLVRYWSDTNSGACAFRIRMTIVDELASKTSLD